jgi:hypothetical protein
MPKLKLTAVYEYEANREHYPGAKTAGEMAAMDLEQANEVLLMALGGLGETQKPSIHPGIVAPCSEPYPKTGCSVPQADGSDPEEPAESGDDRPGEGR